MPIEAGMNRLVWDLHYSPAHTFDGLVMWAGRTRGPRAVPGNYRVRLVVDQDSTEVDFELKQDPRSKATPAELVEQFDFLRDLRDDLSEVHRRIEDIRQVREQVKTALDRAKDTPAHAALDVSAGPLLEDLDSIEQALHQTHNRSPQDPLNFPIRLNNKLAALAGTVAGGDAPPTDQAQAVRRALTAAIQAELDRFEQLKQGAIPQFNALVQEHQVPAIRLPEARKD